MGVSAYRASQICIKEQASSVHDRQTYQAFLSHLDSLPIHQGGRSNDWRLLTKDGPIARVWIAYEQSLASMAQWKKSQKAKRKVADTTKARKVKLDNMKRLYLKGEPEMIPASPANVISEDGTSLLEWATTLDLPDSCSSLI